MKELIFYRCTLCGHAVSPWDIDNGGCPRCGGVHIKPTELTLFEKLAEIVKHPKVWEWDKVTTGQEGQANVHPDS